MANRTYELGRPTNGYRKQRRIIKLSILKPGDTLIMIDHKDKTENLIEIVKIHIESQPGFYWKYKPSIGYTSTPADHHEFFQLGYQLGPKASHTTHFYRARR
jgi:hypothetical protein